MKKRAGLILAGGLSLIGRTGYAAPTTAGRITMRHVGKPIFNVTVPDNLGRPPTSSDVKIDGNADGRSADEVVSLVKNRLRGSFAPANKTFLENTIRNTYRSQALGVWNAMVDQSPTNLFLKNLGADAKISVLGTVSSVKPTIYQVDQGGTTSFYARGDSGNLEPLAKQPYPVIMRTGVDLTGGQVAPSYPHWNAPALAKPVGATITEGK